MPLDSVLSRRAVLLGAAGTGAPLMPGAAYGAVPPSKRFDLTTPSPTPLWRKPLRSDTWLMRSFARDDTRQEVYFLQVEPGSTTGGLIVTRTTATGRHLGRLRPEQTHRPLLQEQLEITANALSHGRDR